MCPQDSVCVCSSSVELTRHLKTECELLPVQWGETVEFMQLMRGHLNLTLLPIYGQSVISFLFRPSLAPLTLEVLGS